MRTLVEIVVQSGVIFLLLGTLFAFVVGVMMWLLPERVVALKQWSDRWLTLRRHTKALELPRYHDPLFYRHHRGVGSAIVVGASYVLYRMAFGAVGELTPAMVDLPERLLFWQWLYDSGITFLVIGSLFAVWVGAVIFFRPSQLKGIEARANRWLSTRQGLRHTDQSYTGLEAVMLRYRWLTGLSLMTGALYTWWLLLGFLLHHPDWLAILTDWVY